MSTTIARWLKRVEYADGLELQRQFQHSRQANEVPDTLLLLEHPPVLTMGRAAKAGNILAPKEQLNRLGVELFETDRGGDVTYHGPGQLVGYPMLYLPPGRQDVRRYVRMLEEVLIRTLRRYGVEGVRAEKYPGVWVENSKLGGTRKIGALGVHLSRWYTRHGFALNIAPQLEHFQLIIPCGIKEAGVTSLEAETGQRLALEEVSRVVAEDFSAVFETAVAFAPAEKTTVQVAALRRAAAEPQTLLLRRSPERGGFWQLVTGSVQPGESPEWAAARELREETGFEVTPRSLHYEQGFAFQDHSPPKVYNAHGFFAVVGEGAEAELSAEHIEARWVSFDEAMSLLPHAGLKETLRRAYSSMA